MIKIEKSKPDSAALDQINRFTRRALIADIDGGIKKEVGIGCSMSGRHCSVCGTDLSTGRCSHRPGEIVDGKLCHVVLSEPTDAYEFSFVAIPAQSRSVTKQEERGE